MMAVDGSERRRADTLSIVIPAHNEERGLPETLRTLIEYLAPTRWDWEVRVVDDGSNDGTRRAVAPGAEITGASPATGSI